MKTEGFSEYMTRQIAAPTLDDDMKVTSTRMPVKVRDAIDRMARKQTRTRADMIRALLIEKLQDMGIVAHHIEEEITK